MGRQLHPRRVMIRRLLGRSLAACLLVGQTVAPAARASSPRLFDVTTAHGVFDGAPVEPSNMFTPDERTIYVWFRCEGLTFAKTGSGVIKASLACS
jgi:hypothetical protein